MPLSPTDRGRLAPDVLVEVLWPPELGIRHPAIVMSLDPLRLAVRTSKDFKVIARHRHQIDFSLPKHARLVNGTFPSGLTHFYAAWVTKEATLDLCTRILGEVDFEETIKVLDAMQKWEKAGYPPVSKTQRR